MVWPTREESEARIWVIRVQEGHTWRTRSDLGLLTLEEAQRITSQWNVPLRIEQVPRNRFERV